VSETRPISMWNVGSVHFGQGSVREAANGLGERGCARAFIVSTPPTRALCDPLIARLGELGIATHVWDRLTGEPTLSDFADALADARDFGADCVIGLGGGSAMDVAKLVAALFDGAQTIDQVVGVDLVTHRSLPLACIPTTAGTGSEVTPIAILEDQKDALKKGTVSRHLVPDIACLDPEMTVSMPRAVTASTGLDALTHCIEAYVNRFSHPMVDGFALEGVRLIGANLARACADGSDLAARAAMLRASYYGGLCLGPVNTGAVHALAYPLGGEFHVPHGVANALLLPHVLRFNLEVAADRYAIIAEALGIARTGDDRRDALAGVDRIEALSRECGVTGGMSGHGISSNAIPHMAAAAITVTRLLDRNPRVVTEEDAVRIYQAAL